jgi:hypothetical protein
MSDEPPQPMIVIEDDGPGICRHCGATITWSATGWLDRAGYGYCEGDLAHDPVPPPEDIQFEISQAG